VPAPFFPGFYNSGIFQPDTGNGPKVPGEPRNGQFPKIERASAVEPWCRARYLVVRAGFV
jgi:hypothetical protein